MSRCVSFVLSCADGFSLNAVFCCLSRTCDILDHVVSTRPDLPVLKCCAEGTSSLRVVQKVLRRITGLMEIYSWQLLSSHTRDFRGGTEPPNSTVIFKNIVGYKDIIKWFHVSQWASVGCPCT